MNKRSTDKSSVDNRAVDRVELPPGFLVHTANVGIKDSSTDFAVVAAKRRCTCAAVYTQSSFAGTSVTLSREASSDGAAQAVVVISKNANVATGERGTADAKEVRSAVAKVLQCDSNDVLIASTGVIGVPYPMERLREHLDSMPPPNTSDAHEFATAIMTTDTHPKVASATAPTTEGSPARFVGVAKGVGMIEPDMATMLAFVFTDAEVDPATLDSTFRRVVERTFNSLSVDTDTSTSDTAAVLANGLAGPVAEADLEVALEGVCLELTKQLAADGEGAQKLIQVHVGGATDDATAKAVAKSVVNSPLVKTAVHGQDPNWGRIVMAIGKVPDAGVDQSRTTVRFGDLVVYPSAVGENGTGLEDLERYLAGDVIEINIDLGGGPGSWTVYGCDLTDGYIRINADYTT